MSSPASVESASDHLRFGLLHFDCDSLWNTLKAEQIAPWQGQVQNWTGKTEELRRNLPVLDVLAQFREADFDPLRQLALELRANCDDLIVVGSTYLLDLARLHELFDGPGGRVARLHFPRSKTWDQKLLPALEAIGSRVGLIILGWCPEEITWERTVPPALAWMKKRYRADELSRRVAGISAQPLAQLLDTPLRHLAVSERAGLAPIYSPFGLFPLFLAGFEASSLIEGSRSQVRAMEKAWSPDSPLVRSAILRQVLTFQDSWGEVVVTPDRFSEPLGLWCRNLLEPLYLGVEPPLPFPFPFLQCSEHDHFVGERGQCYELQLDYGGQRPPEPAQLDRGRPATWLGIPRLDMYTLGGCLAFLHASVALNARWLDFESPALEILAG